ncbi:hypothetical protein WJX72_007519 [[Myrmecia] bisecta]|uniref:20 kDa chaperonin, chloroplastic n=1 Tax=[Myrmecia] bisecta TaxID=41462 RepID=A0AAW1PLX7_9CHLO
MLLDFGPQAPVIEIPSKYKKVTPKGDLVLCKVGDAEEKTTGGVLLPTAAQTKPTSGDIVALGDGRVGDKTQEFSLKVGETVLYSKFGIGVTDLEIEDVLHILIREDDCIGIMPRSGATADDIPKLRPVGDRVLIKVQEAADVTAGGVMLPDAAKEKPISGTVVAVGPGKRSEDGSRKAMKVAEGDHVLYFKYAGDAMETPKGEKYTVVHESDVLCKLPAGQ